MLAALALFVAASTTAPPISVQDNVRPAGRRESGTFSLNLVADVGRWRPEGPEGPAFDVAAFGEESGPLTIPGPFVRVPAGTAVSAAIRNALSSTLVVHGLCGRPSTCKPLTISPGATQGIRFTLEEPGTFHYWATTRGVAIGLRQEDESQLGGAIVVDPVGAAQADRIFVLTSVPAAPPTGAVPDLKLLAINGRPWPHTERLAYAVGDEIRWRVLNLSQDTHAMHLHGSYFTVENTGNGLQDQPYRGDQQRTGVTELIVPGGIFTMRWSPDRSGHWLFHCHMVAHMTARDATDGHGTMDTRAGMAGLVVGIAVTGRDRTAGATRAAARKLTLAIHQDTGRYGSHDGYRFDLEGVDAPRLSEGPVPGPVLVLTRGEPVEITIRNDARESSAVHWHGIELESYFDGVPGWGGAPGNITPPIEPGASFVARFTPPRAGTFIYHTHWHDEMQLSGGLYGALIILEPGQRFDPDTDHIVIMGLNGIETAGSREPFALNGGAAPAPITMKAGMRHRLRLINITPNNVALTFYLTDRGQTSQWRLLSKDGADVPAAQSAPKPARQLVSVGETYDFEWFAGDPRPAWLEVRRGNGEWVLQAPIVIR